MLLFTLMPAGFIGWLPYELLRDFHWTGLLAATGRSGATLMTLAAWVFAMGLRRDASGNGFQVRL